MESKSGLTRSISAVSRPIQRAGPRSPRRAMLESSPGCCGGLDSVVTDASCNEPDTLFSTFRYLACRTRSRGVGHLAVCASISRSTDARGDVLDVWPIYTPLVEADKVINRPRCQAP